LKKKKKKYEQERGNIIKLENSIKESIEQVTKDSNEGNELLKEFSTINTKTIEQQQKLNNFWGSINGDINKNKEDISAILYDYTKKKFIVDLENLILSSSKEQVQEIMDSILQIQEKYQLKI